jgi:hypothetical protein
LCEKGKLLYFTGYHDQVPAAIAAIMDNNGISSLESVVTLRITGKRAWQKLSALLRLRILLGAAPRSLRQEPFRKLIIVPLFGI